MLSEEAEPQSLELHKQQLLNAEPVRALLARQRRLFRPSPLASQFQLPGDFFSLTAEEIKREQRLRCARGIVGGRRGSLTLPEVPQPAPTHAPQHTLSVPRSEAVERLSVLRTKAMREKDEQRDLRRYTYTLLRVRFPDGCLLQGAD